MKRIFLLTALFLATFICMPAFAQDGADDGDEDGMSFGEDEVDAVKAASPVQKFIEEGKKLYKAGSFAEASLLYFKVLQETDVTAEAYHPEAQYELAKTLFKMKLYQGSLIYFSKIVEGGESNPYFVPTLSGLVLLTDEVPEDPLLMEKLASYQELFPNSVPEKYRDRFAFLVGRHLYATLEVDAALEMLNQVTPRSSDYPRAQYIAGVTHVANYDAEPAVDSFKDVLRTLTSKQSTGKLTDPERKLLDLTNLAMARVFYSTGSYDKSLKYYGKINRSSQLWPTALFESSWAYFQVDLYNKALGNLHSLNSPFFRDKYFPEGPILSAVIFFYNCKFPRVRHELEEFAFDYEPLVTEVDALLGQNGEDPEKMYEFLRVNRLDPATPEIGQIVNAALDDLEIRNKLRLIGSIEKEIEKIGDMDSKWKDSALGGTLVQESELAISFAKNAAGEIAAQRLNRISRELDDLSLEREKILVEVAQAERGEIETDLASEMEVKSNVKEAKGVEITDEELYWTFDGEYWRDELGYYIFNINSECKR